MIDYERINELGNINRPLIYVDGPYTNGGEAHNVKNALMYGEFIQSIGGIALVPHQNHIWDLIFQHDAEFWLEQDLHLLKRCDALFRMPGLSAGGDNEIVVANRWGIPVFFDLEVLEKWITIFMQEATKAGAILCRT